MEPTGRVSAASCWDYVGLRWPPVRCRMAPDHSVLALYIVQSNYTNMHIYIYIYTHTYVYIYIYVYITLYSIRSYYTMLYHIVLLYITFYYIKVQQRIILYNII